MDDRESRPDEHDLEPLAKAVRQAYRDRVEVPPEVDDAVRAHARLPFARIRRRRALWLAVPAAAAAVVVLAIYLGPGSGSSPGTAIPDAAPAVAVRPVGPDAPTTHPATPVHDASAAKADVPVPSPSDAPAPEATVTAHDVSVAPPPPPPDDAGARTPGADFNRDGRVNILDAFLLARRIDAGEATDEHWDLSGDGTVDRSDVELIARTAVHASGRRGR